VNLIEIVCLVDDLRTDQCKRMAHVSALDCEKQKARNRIKHKQSLIRLSESGFLFFLVLPGNLCRKASTMIWSTSANLDGDLLVSGWTVTTAWQFAVTCVVVLLTAFAYELIALARPTHAEMFRWRLLSKDCLLVAVRYFIGYELMLIAMTMNLWLLLFIVLGGALGHGVVMHRTRRRRSTTAATSASLLQNDDGGASPMQNDGLVQPQ
jgi:hypothetical protein